MDHVKRVGLLLFHHAKMLAILIFAILLLGLNAAAFYLTDTFGRVEHLGPGEDPPLRAKFFAASSLILWFAVIALGRYIQSFSDTISVQ